MPSRSSTTRAIAPRGASPRTSAVGSVPASRSRVAGRYTRPILASSATSREMFVSCIAIPRSSANGNAAFSRTPITPHIISPTVPATR